MTDRDTAQNSRKEAAELSRQQFLDTGIELLLEGVGTPFMRVRAKDVVDRTSFTTGAFYHHWPTQEAYRVELFEYLGGTAIVEANIDSYLEVMAASSEPSAEVFRQLLAQEVIDVTNEPRWWLEVAMVAGNVADELEVLRTQRDRWIDEIAHFYSGILAAFGLELADGLTLRWLTQSLMALVDGYSLQLRTGGDVDTGIANDPWTAHDLAAATILTASLRRIGEPAFVEMNVRERWATLFTAPE